jgi:hypothetical protein
MGKSFKGIERFYPCRIIEEGDKANEFDASVKPNRISISKDELEPAKAPLSKRLLEVTDRTELGALLRAWAEIKAAI